MLILPISGCASAKQTGYSSKYAQMQKGEDLEKLYVDKAFNPRTYEVVVVTLDKINLNPSKIVSVEEMQDYLRNETIYQLRNSHIFKEVAERVNEDEPKKTLLCHVVLTELNPGSRMARWLFSEFGAGHSKVQVEGKFIDADTNVEMLSFVDRRTGGAALDITGGDPKNLLREDIRNVIKGVVKTLDKLPEYSNQ